jgi:serine/threonine protein kinase
LESILINKFRGGCGIVWLCSNENEQYAVKQIVKKKSDNNINTIIARKEIDILNFLQNRQDPDNNYIINLIDYIEDSNDLWLIFEKGGKNLSNLIFKIKGEFMSNERIYSIKKGKLLVEFFNNIIHFKTFFKKMLQFLHFLNKNGIVHCDIKPDNILVEYDYDENASFFIKSVKMIDFGSAFFINSPDNFSSNTPEYMCPEINELTEKNASMKDITAFLKGLKCYSWSIDIWSLGVTILEIIQSCPLWMNYKAKVIIHGKTYFKTGLFGVKGRNNSKIYTRQQEVSNSVPKLVIESLVKDQDDQDVLIDLLSQMLDFNYKTRISPLLALQHDFFK